MLASESILEVKLASLDIAVRLYTLAVKFTSSDKGECSNICR